MKGDNLMWYLLLGVGLYVGYRAIQLAAGEALLNVAQNDPTLAAQALNINSGSGY